MKLNNPLERVRDVIHAGMGQQSSEGRALIYIHLDQLDPNPFQPRRNINGPAFDELCQSIAESGVIEPIIIRRKEDRYEIISGERRWRACLKLGLREIPCILKNVSDEESFKLALTENLQRNNLSPLEEAVAFQRMLDLKIAHNQAEIGEILGIRQQRVSDKLRLIQLPSEVQAYFGDAQYQDYFSQKHGEILARLQDVQQIHDVANKIIQEHLSTRETRRLVDRLTKRSNKTTLGRMRSFRQIQLTKNRHGFRLTLAFDERRDSLDETLRELLEIVEKIRKEFIERGGQMASRS